MTATAPSQLDLLPTQPLSEPPPTMRTTRFDQSTCLKNLTLHVFFFVLSEHRSWQFLMKNYSKIIVPGNVIRGNRSRQTRTLGRCDPFTDHLQKKWGETNKHYTRPAPPPPQKAAPGNVLFCPQRKRHGHGRCCLPHHVNSSSFARKTIRLHQQNNDNNRIHGEMATSTYTTCAN